MKTPQWTVSNQHMLTTGRPVLWNMVQCTQNYRPGDKATLGEAK